MIDIKRLAAEVSAQHGIRIDADDPMMAVVTLNRLVFEQAVSQVLDGMQAAVRDFESAADKVQVRAGGVLAQEVRDCTVSMKNGVEDAVAEFRGIHAGSHPQKQAERKWLAIGAAIALLLFGIGIWVGATLRQQPFGG